MSNRNSFIESTKETDERLEVDVHIDNSKVIVKFEKKNTKLRDYRLSTLVKEQSEVSKYALNLEHKLEWYDNKFTKAKEIIDKLSKSLFLAKGIVRDLIDDTVDFKESKERAIYCYEQEKFDTYKEAVQFLKGVSE